MKVLWLSNVLFPEVCQELDIKVPVIGGWMYSGALNLINNNPEIKLAVAVLYSGSEFQCITKYSITYYLIPDKGGNQKYNKDLERFYINITDSFKPDLVHIHGSEYPHSLAYVKACGVDRVVLSIQGLVSVYAKYYFAGIDIKDLKSSITLRDVLRKDTLINQQKSMLNRGAYEIELIKKVKHIIGRTSWDESNVWGINSSVKYHFCNETLRELFYNKQWKYESCEKYTIFLSQAHYPIKGIHKIIEALPLILRSYPNTKVYVAGNDFVNVPWYKKNGFANYLEKIMKKYNLNDSIVFLGMLTESEMVERYLLANVFLCPSSIENSPNSVGEAQLIGTPCVASYVGGTMDMVENGVTGLLYRFEEKTLLAKHICDIFQNRVLAEYLSKNARRTAFSRHDKDLNSKALNDIYKRIVDENILHT